MFQFLFGTVPYCVTQTSLELTLWPSVTLNSISPVSASPSRRNIDMYHHAHVFTGIRRLQTGGALKAGVLDLPV